MHTGTAVERNGDWFGATVNRAARVSAAAGGGEVLLTEATKRAAGDVRGVELRESGRRELRNVAAPVLLFSAVPLGSMSPRGLPIDPVCRMAVDPSHGAGMLRHDGAELYFCSLSCGECSPPLPSAIRAGRHERRVRVAGASRVAREPRGLPIASTLRRRVDP